MYCTHLISCVGCTVLENVSKSYSVRSSTLNEYIDLYASIYPSIFILLFSFINRFFVNRLLAADSNKVCLHVHPLSLPYTFAVYEESVHSPPPFFSQSQTQSRSNDFLTVYNISLIFSYFLTFSVVFSNFLLFSLFSSCIFRLCSWC